MVIFENTLSTIIPVFSGYELTIYCRKNVLFRKVYATMASAKIAESKLLKKYNLSVY